jgi:hypothetical protein
MDHIAMHRQMGKKIFMMGKIKVSHGKKPRLTEKH